MLYRKMKTGLLAVALAGLCSLAVANTMSAPLMLAQNDITLMPGGPAPESVETEAVPAPDVMPVPQPGAAAPGSAIPGAPGSTRIALMLPLHSGALGAAAAAVREGFLAAYEKEHDAAISLDVVETGDSAQDSLDAYNIALADHDIVVGPLSRSGAGAIAAGGNVIKPTLALTQADAIGEAGAATPQLLAIGLSVEDEARQASGWAALEYPGERALVVSTSTAWQRRAARAFQADWRRRGLAADVVELSAAGGNLSPTALQQLGERIRSAQPGLVFAALDAVQARQLRESMGGDIALYGTSQLNPHTLSGWSAAERQTAMDGVRFIDLPWMVKPDDPAVAPYLRPGAQPRGGDLERLYALGIDAYRVAREVAQQHSVIDIDGVTGRLRISFGAGPARFERTEAQAVFQDGAAAPLSGAR